MKFRIVYLISGLLFGFLITRQCSPVKQTEIIKSDTVQLITVRDSIVFKDSIVFQIDTLWKTKYVYKDAPINPGEDSTSVYMDSTKLKPGFHLYYTANVTGRLNWVKFSFMDVNPDTVTIIEKSKTITNTISPNGFYALGGLKSNSTFNFGAAYLKNKWQYQYSLTPTDEKWLHEFKIGYKIF